MITILQRSFLGNIDTTGNVLRKDNSNDFSS